MPLIALTHGFHTEVDDEDAASVSRWRWHVQEGRGLRYARRNVRAAGRTHSIYLHRLIMNAPAGMDVDHINRNGLDNRRCNLRVVTRAENLWNSRRVEDAAPSWSRRRNKWRVTIDYKGRRYDVGFWDDHAKAIKARDFVAAVIRGKPAEPFDTLELSPSTRGLIQSLLGSVEFGLALFTGPGA